MSNETFDFNVFIKESKDVLINPKSYFSTMKTSGGMTEPLIKAALYGMLAGFFSFLWSLLKIGAISGGIFGSAVGIMVFVWSIVSAIIGLFIVGVVVLIISAICKGNTDYEANVRVTASIMVIMPISAFLNFAGGINLYLGIIIGLLVNIYALWLLYNGLVEALKSKPETTKIVTYILIALFILFMLAGLGAKRAANKFMNDFNSSDVQELFKDSNSN